MNGIMKGVGTVADPYLCEDIFDFCNITKYDGRSDELHYVKLVNNIDFNDHPTYKLGINVTIVNAPFVVFRGNNKEIRNVVVQTILSAGTFNFYSISDTLFPNFVCTVRKKNSGSEGIFDFYTFERCSFCYNLKNSCFNMLVKEPNTDKKHYFTECTFNISGVHLSTIKFKSYYQDYQFTRCHINFDGLILDNELRTGYDSQHKILFENGNFINVYFTGNIKMKTNNITVNYTLLQFIYDGILNNSYFKVNLLSIPSLATSLTLSHRSYTNVFSSMCFIEKDSFSRFSLNNVDNCKFLTSEQCKSTEYLESIGFLVAGG